MEYDDDDDDDDGDGFEKDDSDNVDYDTEESNDTTSHATLKNKFSKTYAYSCSRPGLRVWHRGKRVRPSVQSSECTTNLSARSSSCRLTKPGKNVTRD